MKLIEFVITFADETICMNGRIDHANVMAVYYKCLDFLKIKYRSRDLSNLIFDFEKVNTPDSTALALMVELVKQARLKKINVIFHNLPEQIQAIAKAADMEELLLHK